MLNPLEGAGEKLGCRTLKRRLACQGGFKPGLPDESFIAAGFGTAFGAEQKRDLLLGQAQAFSIGTQVIGKLFRRHVL
jgi:hypothetical protein